MFHSMYRPSCRTSGDAAYASPSCRTGGDAVYAGPSCRTGGDAVYAGLSCRTGGDAVYAGLSAEDEIRAVFRMLFRGRITAFAFCFRSVQPGGKLLNLLIKNIF